MTKETKLKVAGFLVGIVLALAAIDLVFALSSRYQNSVVERVSNESIPELTAILGSDANPLEKGIAYDYLITKTLSGPHQLRLM